MGMNRPDRTARLDHTLRFRNHYHCRVGKRLVGLYVVNLQCRKLEAEWRTAVLMQKIERRSVRNNGFDLDLLFGGTDHTLIKVHLASFCTRGRNLYVKTAQPDLVELVWMEKQGGPGPHDGHSIDGGQRGVMRIAVSPKNQALCYISRVGQISTAVALHVHLAAKGFLQQWMYLAVAERPENKHECDSSKPKTEGANRHQLKDEPSMFPRMSSYVHNHGSVRLAAIECSRAPLWLVEKAQSLAIEKQCRGLPPPMAPVS